MTAATLAPVTAADFDYYEADKAKWLMHDVRDEMQAFFATDAELDAMIAETYHFDARNWSEGGKFEINDFYANEARFAMLVRVQEERDNRRAVEAALAASREAVAAGPLSYNPFAGLAVA